MGDTDGTPFQWERPRLVVLTPQQLKLGRAYAAACSLPPCEFDPRLPRVVELATDDGPDIDCITCLDSGLVGVGELVTPMPCPDCFRGDYTWQQELYEEMAAER